MSKSEPVLSQVEREAIRMAVSMGLLNGQVVIEVTGVVEQIVMERAEKAALTELTREAVEGSGSGGVAQRERQIAALQEEIDTLRRDVANLKSRLA